MLERAAQLFPARREGILLLVFWLLAEFGIIFSAGMGMRSVCGGIFAAALLWLSFLDLRDGMLYDCITLPFAALGLIFSMAGVGSVTDAMIGGTLCGVLFYCLYIAARGGLGGGDVKFAAGLGLWLGWEAARQRRFFSSRAAGSGTMEFRSARFWRWADTLALLPAIISGVSTGGRGDALPAGAGDCSVEHIARTLHFRRAALDGASGGAFYLRACGGGV